MTTPTRATPKRATRSTPTSPTPRGSPSALAEYADEATDVPALVARNQALESRARVAEYDLRVATEDLERVERERADALARLAAPRDPSRASRDASRPPAGVDGDPSRLFQDVLGDARSPPSSSPLPPPDDAERHALNVIVDEYLGERGYRAARLVLRDETAADAGGGVLDDWTAIQAGNPPAATRFDDSRDARARSKRRIRNVSRRRNARWTRRRRGRRRRR